MTEISLKEQFELPLVQDLIEENDKLRETALLQTGTKIPDSKIEKIKVPYRIKNKLLMKPGEFNGVIYPLEEIKARVSEANEKGLILDHKDTQNEGTSAWVGKVENVKWEDTGEDGPGMYGDLVIVDKPVAQKLAAGAKWGISPTIDFERNELDGKVIGTDLLWKSFSFVIQPAVRETMLNAKQEDKKMAEEKLARKKKYPSKYPYKYPYKKGKGEKELEVSEEVLETLKAKDELIAELKKFKDEIETSRKKELVSELTANEFLIGRIDESELEDRQKYLMGKSTEVLSELAEVIGNHAELSAYTSFIKKYLKEHKGASIKEAAKAWKKGKSKLEEENKEEEKPVEENKESEAEEEKEEEKDEASLTRTDGSRVTSELAISKANPDVIDLDVGMYNFLAKQVPGGMMIK